MAGFTVGQQVVVKADNDYDKGICRDPGNLMSSYYGNVTAVSGRCVYVRLIGRHYGDPSVLTAREHPWAFYAHELEAVD